jgi:hypothetical protein
MTGRGVWVYAVGTAVEEPWLGKTRGVDGEPVRVVRDGGLAAVVGSVDLARFGEDGLQRSLNDLDQLERIARAHHDVVDAVALRSAVAPTRLATIYEDDSAVRAMLQRHGDAFRSALQQVSGRQEWGVKGYVRAQPAPSADQVTPASGTDYLRQRQAMLNARNASRRSAVAAADAIHTRLRSIAVAARQHRPQDPHLTGDDRSMLLNGAYLVADDLADRFREEVSSVAGAQSELEVQLTGPWPPYSFTAVDDEGSRP